MLAGVGAVGRVGRHGISGGAKRPSFSVDFVNGGGSLGAGAVFTRASTGMYYNSSGVLVSAAIDAPRFDYDPATLQLKGLLLEDTSTNLVLQSGDMSNASWSKTGVTATAPVVTGNVAVAPDGTTTASSIVLPAVATNQVSIVTQTIAAVANIYTFSVWLKGSVGGEVTYLRATPDAVTFYRLACTLTTQWQRFSLITNTLTVASWFFGIGNDARANGPATAAQTIYAWGGQVEALPYASSYIPTTTVAVTRAVDSLRYPIASVTGFSTTQGSLAHEYMLEGTKTFFGSPAQFVGAVSNTDWISLDQLTNTGGSTGALPNMATANISVGFVGKGSVNFAITPLTPNVVHRGASSWALGNNMAGAHNGVGPVSNGIATDTLPTVVNLTIAGTMNSQSPISQWARRTRYWPRQLSQAELISATVLDGPTLSLDFMSDGTLDPRITFARASSATYTDANGVVRTAATNAPRWDYANGVLRGLLIEEARTNLALQSGDLSNAVWIPGGIGSAPPVVTGNAAVAPRRDNNSDKHCIACGGNNQVSVISQGRTVTAVVHSFSVWLKGSVGEITYIRATPDAVIFYRQQCVLTTQWQRFTLITSALTATNWNFAIGGDARSGPTTLAQTIYAWGAQVEQGAFPTSYIPTTSVSVTRAIENVSMPTGPWFSTAASTLYAEFQFPRLTTTGVSAHDVVSLEGNQNALTIRAMEGPSSNASFRTYNFGVTGRADLAGTMTTGSTKIAAAWGATRNAGSYRGNAVGSYAAALPINMNALIIGNASVNNNSVLGGWVRRVLYWNRALSDTELQQVTT